jgi:hypothetical protein
MFSAGVDGVKPDRKWVGDPGPVGTKGAASDYILYVAS